MVLSPAAVSVMTVLAGEHKLGLSFGTRVFGSRVAIVPGRLVYSIQSIYRKLGWPHSSGYPQSTGICRLCLQVQGEQASICTQIGVFGYGWPRNSDCGSPRAV